MDLSSDFSLDASGSRLLSESPILPSSSSSDADLSISELSLSDRPTTPDKPFSLLAPVQTRHSEPDTEDDGEGEITQRQIVLHDEGENDTAEKRDQDQRIKAKSREEKLQNDIFVLRKLNSAFSSFNEALEDVGDANERISRQLAQTEGLLNKYMDILAKSEQFSRLIFDEEWEGAEQDDTIIQHEHEERIERARKEAEERALAEQRERERLEREAKEKRDREERERVERERKEQAANRSTSGVRGVRGTRASMRATRNATSSSRASATGSRARGTARESGITRGTIKRS